MLKKKRRDAAYKLYVDLTQTVKEVFKNSTEEQMQRSIGAYMQLMNPPEDAKEITLTPDEIKQTALLAAQSMSRQLYERVK